MKRHILILVLFICLTLSMTYPLVLHMHTAVQEPGDSLFITWTIAWDIKALLSDPLNIFHANIFHPYKYTLAYSEHMIGVGLLALPIYIFIKNPLFIYNFMLLLSFILCGWGAYLLTYHLTKDRLAGIVSGIIFSFCPFRFDQFGHLHVLTSQWIPIVLLFLHRMCEARPRTFRWELGFGFFFFLQFISSGHNGLYLAVAVALFMLYFKVFPWKALLIVGILILPFYYPHIYLAREFGFERQAYEFKLYSPQLSSYLAVPNSNWLYGKYLSRFCRPEAVMFPGLIALLLIFWKKMPRFRKIKFSTINVFIMLDLLIIFLIIVTDGIDLGISILGVKLKVTDFTRPVYILLFLLGIKIFKNLGIVKNILRKIIKNKGPVQFYWILGVIAFLLSFGPTVRAMDKDVMWGPYSLFYNFVPGFKGIRVSGRIYTIFILAIAVLAGFGLKRLKSTKIGYYISWIIPFIILAEYINIPISLNCWIGTNPSPVYRWLANQPDDSVIIELPMPDWYSMFWHEIQYMYWSIYHNKKLINGYSGYSPPSYWPIAEKMKDFPNDDAIEILKYLGVRYVIVHEGEIKAWEWPSVVKKMEGYKDVLNLRFKDGEDYIYKMVVAEPRPFFERGATSLKTKNKWIITTNCNSKDIQNAIDNNLLTRWHSEKKQEPGIYVELDLGEMQKIRAISMDFGRSNMDFPRGIGLEISKDKRQWEKISLNFVYANYVKHLLKYPKDNRMILDFEPIEARYIKITQTGWHKVFFWSIYELEVMEAI